MIAAIDSRVATAIAVAGGLVVFGALLVATASGDLRGKRKSKVPAAFRPAPGDEELERSVMERYLLWSGLAVLFMAIWIPGYWLREPTREAAVRVRLSNLAIDSGGELFNSLCAQCHGANAEGGPRTVVDPGSGRSLSYAEPPLKFIFDRYRQAGRKDDEITQLMYDAINRGRSGTPMPTWGLAFGGPLNTAQVDDVVQFLQFVQVPAKPGPDNPSFKIPAGDPKDGAAIFLANCAICHNAPDEQTAMLADPSLVKALAGKGGIGPNLRVALQRHPAFCPADTALCTGSLKSIITLGRLNTNRPSMPAWAALGDQAIDALVRFLMSIQRG